MFASVKLEVNALFRGFQTQVYALKSVVQEVSADLVLQEQFSPLSIAECIYQHLEANAGKNLATALAEPFW